VYISAEYDMSESVPAFIEIFTETAPPTNLQAVAKDLTTDTIVLSWEASLTIDVTYRVYVDGSSIELGDVLEYEASGFEPGSSHDFYVVAVVPISISDPTPIITATTYIDPPFNLLNINTLTTEYTLAYEWQSAVARTYELTLSGGGSNVVDTTATENYEFSGLFSGEKYEVSIRSIDGDLCSYSVDFDNPYYTIVAPVENLTANPGGGAAGSTSIDLTWSLSPADYGSPSNVRYDIYVNSAGPVTLLGGTETFTLLNLNPSTNYTFDVETRRLDPRRTSSIVTVTASTNPPSYPTMTWSSNSDAYAVASDTIAYGILLAQGGVWITDISGGDVWSVTLPDGNMNPLGVEPVFNNPRGISYNPLSPGTPLLLAHADGVSAVSLDGRTQVPIPGAAGGGWGMTTDSNGNTYVTIPEIQTVQFIDPAGNVSDYALTGLESSPEGIALADNGYLYIADSSLNAVTYITPAGAIETLVSGLPFVSPSAIVYSIDGNLYVADRVNRKIFQVTLAGSVSEFTELDFGYTPLSMTQNPVTGNLYTTHPNGTITEIQVTLT
jgi:sugar lactone lactonase YvrE